MSSHTRTAASDTQVEAMIRDLRLAMRGDVIDPTHGEYEQARRVWNGLVDRHPAVIVRCADTADVVEAVRVARRHRPPVSIRGGGHQIAGSGVVDEGLVIDLSAMNHVDVDAGTRTARVGGGATWGHVDRATQAHGLATPGGEVSTTGVGGFTLGGGMGLIMRAHGLACDNLRAVEIVTADGQVRTASRDENPDLFWALRGGGRGIGVVTSFEFALHPLGPDVAIAQAFYPYEQAEQVLRAWPDLVDAMPDTVCPQLILWSVPPDASIPEALHGRKVVIALGLFAGPAEQGAEVLEPMRQLGTPLLDASGTVTYVDVQASVDALFPAGGRYYMKSHFLDELSADAVDIILRWDARRPTPESLVVLRTVDGAVARVGPEESAYPHRTARYNLSIDAGWTDPALDGVAMGWARAAWEATRPFATGGVYINFSGLSEEAAGLRSSVYGANQTRLAAIREAHDPDGVFSGAAQRP
jgi:FAD/FMN-containing dehydrogenase